MSEDLITEDLEIDEEELGADEQNKIVGIKLLNEKEVLEKYLDNYMDMLEDVMEEFAENVFSNKWTQISNKNCWFNFDIAACYPNFHKNYQKIDLDKDETVEGALEIIRDNEEYQRYGIEWDVQTRKESINSFYNKWHPMEDEEYKANNPNIKDSHLVKTWRGLTYKSGEKMLSYNNDPGELGAMNGGLLIPIFRLGDPEDYEEFESIDEDETDEIVQTYDEKILLNFIKYNFIPDVIEEDEEILEKFQILHRDFELFSDYILVDEESEDAYYKWDLDELCKNIVENCLDEDFVKEAQLELEFENGDREARNYVDGVLEGDSEYFYVNGDKEIRSYIDGIIQGEGIFYPANDEKPKIYWYENGEKRDITTLRNLLNVDKIRVNLDVYDENILTDPNRGNWDLFEMEDISEVESVVEKKIYRRDPKKDIKLGGIVGIDFGTKSTVVVYQDDNNKTLPMRISGGSLNLEARDLDYENPTVIEFKDIESFMKDYNEKEGRPFTKWNDVTVSHTAVQNLINGTSGDFYSIISDLKQWAGEKNEKIIVRDKKGIEMVLPEYMEVGEGDIDPIELYAYYIGSYINNMRNGIYMEYLLSFPVTYEKAVREKILESFKRGIKKSLPVSILKDDEAMERFRVIHGANEPAAYAACALQEYGFEPDDDEAVYYGVFDFGGGTADFDFGIWKPSEDDRNFDYELIHFGAGGDRYLGGENILKELAYEVVKENQDVLRKKKIAFARPEWCDRFIGDEGLIDNSSEAKLNIKVLMEKLRPFWENPSDEESQENIIKLNLYAKDGSLKTGVEISIDRENVDSIIESKIDRGIENFFIALKKAMKDEPAEEIKVFLAGNSCKHPKVMELFEEHIENFDGEIEIFPALGTEEAYEKMEELEIEIDPEDRTNPTGKTGVAYGIIDSRIGGRIDVKNRDEAKNLNNEINFKYYVGYEGRKKFRVVVGPETEYNQFIYFLDVKPMVDLFYTTLPEAMENKMPIAKAKRKRLSFKEDYVGGKIYIKSVSPNSIEYVVTKKDIEEKEYLEEKIIELD